MAFVPLNPNVRPDAAMTVLPNKLGIVAGGGALPHKLIAHCRAQGTDVFVMGIEGHVDEPSLKNLPHTILRIGLAGQMIKMLKDKGYMDIVIIGSVKRPKLLEMRPDMRTLSFFARLGLKALGDDGLLKAVRKDLERDGFTLHAIQDLMPDILMPRGVLGRVVPNDDQYEDIRLGINACMDIGEADIGQSVVVMGGDVIGTEDSDGTNALIKRCPTKGAILVKCAKPQQDRKLDMPTLGPDTVRLCAELGYAGIAAEQGGVLMVDRDAMITCANQANLFLVGV